MVQSAHLLYRVYIADARRYISALAFFGAFLQEGQALYKPYICFYEFTYRTNGASVLKYFPHCSLLQVWDHNIHTTPLLALNFSVQIFELCKNCNHIKMKRFLRCFLTFRRFFMTECPQYLH